MGVAVAEDNKPLAIAATVYSVVTGCVAISTRFSRGRDQRYFQNKKDAVYEKEIKELQESK